MAFVILNLYIFALNCLYFSGLYRLAAPFVRGQGIIFTLHQVNNKPIAEFAPNSILSITPEFLEQTIETVRKSGYDIISLDEMRDRISKGLSTKSYAVFTSDDGYRDNRDCALPILKKHNVPLAIYIVSDYSSEKGELWWVILEDIIQQSTSLQNPFNKSQVFKTETAKEKYHAFDKIYWPLRKSNQQEQRRLIRKMAEDNNLDIDKITKDLIMNWEELRELNKEPLITLAAHTKSHFALSQLSASEANEEVLGGMDVMERELGERPIHFSFPYGSPCCAGTRDFEILKDLNLQTAVTTRKGMLYAEHKNHLTALPRVSLNGEYQKQKYIKTYLSGLPFRLKNKGRKLDIT